MWLRSKIDAKFLTFWPDVKIRRWLGEISVRVSTLRSTCLQPPPSARLKVRLKEQQQNRTPSNYVGRPNKKATSYICRPTDRQRHTDRQTDRQTRGRIHNGLFDWDTTTVGRAATTTLGGQANKRVMTAKKNLDQQRTWNRHTTAAT